MSYKGNSEEEALGNLNETVRKRFEKDLLSAEFIVHSQSKDTAWPGFNVDFKAKPEDYLKAWEIISEELERFLRDRYAWVTQKGLQL